MDNTSMHSRVAMSTMDNPLLKYNAKEYFFKASLCHFIVDELNAKLAIEKYEEMFPAFSDSRELKLLKVVEKEFACPCDPEWNSWFVSGYFLVPAFLSFILTLPVQGCRCLSGCCMCVTDILTSLTPAFVWMLLLFFDGHYYACGMTDWSGRYATIDENVVEKWCEPANSTSSLDMLIRTQEWFVHSQ
ncbi:hypothetical protein INR49_021375, partial [Caranx melampygus]